jgi:hypothetical protein
MLLKTRHGSLFKCRLHYSGCDDGYIQFAIYKYNNYYRSVYFYMAQRWLNQLKPRDAFVRLKPSATGFSSLQGQIFRDSCSEVDAFSQPTFRASIQDN